EAEAVARLQHPNIVQIFEVGVCDGRPFLVMEYVEGGSLADRLAAEPLPGEATAGLAHAPAGALDHAHRRGIIHPGLKASDILLAGVRGEGSGVRADPRGAARGLETSCLTPHPSPLTPTPKITEFGLAKLVEADGLTQFDAVLGTPCYMAPEQTGGKNKEVGP